LEVDGRTNEAVLAAWLDGRQTPNSGAGKWKKGDVVFCTPRSDFRTDLKSTSKDRFVFKQDSFDRLTKRCVLREIPTFVVGFCEDGELRELHTYVIISEPDFGSLTREVGLEISHISSFPGRQCTVYADLMEQLSRRQCTRVIRINLEGSGESFVLLSWIDFAAAVQQLRSRTS